MKTKTLLFIPLILMYCLSSKCYCADEQQSPSITLDVLKVGDRIVPFQSGMPLPTFERQDREYVDLAGKWKKQRVEVDHRLTLRARNASVVSALEKECGGRQSAGFNDSEWELHTVPGVENPVPDRYMGGVWYRRNFKVPATANGKLVRLMFEGANYVTDVWINGKWAGTHEGGYTPFAFDVTDMLNIGGENIIAVRVDNIPWIPMGQDESGMKANDKNIVPYKTCDWWNYTGILRGVYLELAPDISIARADIRTQLTGDKSATAEIGVVIFNRNGRKLSSGTKLKTTIYEANVTQQNLLSLCAKDIADFSKPVKNSGNADIELAGGKEKVLTQTINLSLPSVDLWTPENPKLYVLEISLAGKDVTDKYYTQFGVREVKVDAKECRLLINKEPVFLRGASRTEVFPGEKEMNLPPAKFMLRDLKILKDINVDFIRAGHWPNSTLMYLLADRLGFVMWEEIPAFWLDGPAFDLQRKERKVTWQMFMEMIYKDYNRPSVMFWGTCNECGWGKERILYIQSLKQSAYMVDGTRLIAQSAVGNDPGDKTQVDCDVMGFTMYYGVFYGKANIYDDTMEALEKMHETFPTKPIIATEYGYWSESDMASASEQVRIAKETLRALKNHSSVAGAMWWASFDWHTMITDPQTMGLINWDRKTIKPVYYEVQKNYAALAGDWPIELISPQTKRVAGAMDVSVRIPKDMPAKDMKYSLDYGDYQPMKSSVPGIYSASCNTVKLSEGKHILDIKGVGPVGQVMSLQSELTVDNVDNPPEIQFISPRDKDFVMGRTRIRALVEDDRGISKAEMAIGQLPAVEMTKENDNNYTAFIESAKLSDGKTYTVKIIATDTGGNTTRQAINVTIDNTRGIYINLPYNHDWIASKEDLGDGTGYDFPADNLPDSKSAFIFNSKTGPLKFMFGDKAPLGRNNMECYGQTLPVKFGRYSKLYMLGAMHNDSKKVPFTLLYTDGTSERVYAAFSDWWRGAPVFGEEIAFFAPKHLEKDGFKKPGAGLYVQSVPVDEKRVLKAVLAPNDDKLRLFAMTAIGKEVTDLPPTVEVKYPKKGDILQGSFTPSVIIPDTDIEKITYLMDGQKLSEKGIDTKNIKDGEHIFKVVAQDKAKQLGIQEVNITVSNNHNVISPVANGRVSRLLKVVLEPRYKSDIAAVSYGIDNAEYTQITPDEKGRYEAVWPVSKDFKPGSRHNLFMRIKEKSDKVTEQKIPFEIAIPITGHSIKVDKNILDWVGKPPKKDNTYAISEGEFIWKDAIGDDKGSGTYTYPFSPSFKNCADIKEVHVTFDKRCLYLLIKAEKPGDWWAPYRLIGIHKDGSQEPATEVLAQGALEQMSADNGCYGEIKVAPELACQYIIGIHGTYKGRIWNAKGELVAKKDGSPSDTPEFKIDDDNWENIEIAVPFSVIGNPAGQTWKFSIGMGAQDGEMLREVASVQSEWNGGGGEGEASSAAGVDPDLYDLIGSDRKTQEAELTGYNLQGKAGDQKAFVVIKNSYITVTFAE